ncbi:hypothetical protein BC332_27609 [Capsicum chinense]|nr:hypothetical protein BC332_27609 [Capsicum chinense]
MLLRSSSSPLLNSWKPKSCGSSPESDLLPITTQQLIRTRSVLMSTSFGPDESPTKHAPNRSRDPAVQKKNINGSKREVKTMVPAKLKDKELGSTGVRILLSNSGLGKSEEDKERGLKTLVAGGVGGGGGGGGRVCGGGGSGGTRDGDGSGSQDSNSWHGYKSTDVYYQKMIEAYPRNGLLLANYARYLKEAMKKESDSTRVSYVLASYARFLWNAKEEDLNEAEEEKLSKQFGMQNENSAPAPNFFSASSHRPPMTATS